MRNNNIKIFGIHIISLMIFCSSCAQNRELLTIEEKQWNPYKKGQSLIFESSDKERDTVNIIDVQQNFPDGIGIVTFNERIRVLAKHNSPLRRGTIESYIFGIIAKTNKHPTYYKFEINVANALFPDNKYQLDYLNNLSEIEVQVEAGYFDDVIVIGNPQDYSSVTNAIEVIYWSKSVGYIRFDKYDGTSWRLVRIIDPE